MIRHAVLATALVASLAGTASANQSPGESLRTYRANEHIGAAHAARPYKTERGAARHCPTDAVVWLNTGSGIFYAKGMHWYGRTKDGVYVCRREATHAGNRAARNDK